LLSDFILRFWRVEKVWRWFIFNILAPDKDVHSKNFSFKAAIAIKYGLSHLFITLNFFWYEYLSPNLLLKEKKSNYLPCKALHNLIQVFSGQSTMHSDNTFFQVMIAKVL